MWPCGTRARAVWLAQARLVGSSPPPLLSFRRTPREHRRAPPPSGIPSANPQRRWRGSSPTLQPPHGGTRTPASPCSRAPRVGTRPPHCSPHLALLKLSRSARAAPGSNYPSVHAVSALVLVQVQREDVAPLPVRGEPRGGEWPRRRLHLRQGEAGEQPAFPVPGEVAFVSLAALVMRRRSRLRKVVHVAGWLFLVSESTPALISGRRSIDELTSEDPNQVRGLPYWYLFLQPHVMIFNSEWCKNVQSWVYFMDCVA